MLYQKEGKRKKVKRKTEKEYLKSYTKSEGRKEKKRRTKGEKGMGKIYQKERKKR